MLATRSLPARRSTDIPDGLVRAARTARIPVSHRLPPRGYDEPEGLCYAISSICPLSAVGEQSKVPRAMSRIASFGSLTSRRRMRLRACCSGYEDAHPHHADRLQEKERKSK